MGISSCGLFPLDKEIDLPELPYTNNLQKAIDQVLLAYLEYDLGISAAVLVPGYRTWTGASGYSHQSVLITNDMLFDVGSVQKNFEAALVLKLVEDDVLSLDDPISKYLPTYTNVDGNITIRQLLNHTSGVFNVFEHPDFPWVGTDVDYSKEWKVEEVFNNFVREPYCPPGYAQHYSSANYLLVTKIIEEATGSTVPDEMECYFLEPMKLENTFITMGEPPPLKYSVAHPWVDIDRDGELDDLHGIPLTWSATLTHPVMYSTPSDLVRWMNALYHEGSVVSPRSMAEMLTYPETKLRGPDTYKMGLGVIDYSEYLDKQALGHGGSALGYTSAVLYLPESGISLAYLINTGESPVELANHLWFDTRSAILRVIKANQLVR
jgi:D-alanyl-D-alanine carboxypeptidase